MYDALVSADIVTDDPDGWAAAIVDLLGLPAPRPNAFLEPEGHGFRAAWLRAQPSLRQAPTRIELIAARPRSAPHDHVEERIAAQGARPIRTHATVLAAGDIDEVIARLRASGIRHRVTPMSDDFAFPRVWLGVTEDDPTGYDPTVDAGLWTEIVPTAHSGIPAPEDARVDDPEGVVRIVARRFLVPDAVDAARVLEENLGLVARDVATTPAEIVARFEFQYHLSAGLELVQPRVDESDEARFMARWGAGPHAIVLGVGDLTKAAAALDERGIECSHGARGPGDERLLLPAHLTAGTPLELVGV